MSLWVQQINGSDFSDRDYQAMIEDYKNNFKDLSFSLESTDAAGRVAHPSPTRRDAGRGVQRG